MFCFCPFSVSIFHAIAYISASGNIQKLGTQFSEPPHPNQSKYHLVGLCFDPGGDVFVHFHVPEALEHKLAWEKMLHLSFRIFKAQDLLSTTIDYCHKCQIVFKDYIALSRDPTWVPRHFARCLLFFAVKKMRNASRAVILYVKLTSGTKVVLRIRIYLEGRRMTYIQE